MYDEVVNEDVPEDFLSFLEQADERSQGASSNTVNGTDENEPAPQPRAVKTEP